MVDRIVEAVVVVGDSVVDVVFGFSVVGPGKTKQALAFQFFM